MVSTEGVNPGTAVYVGDLGIILSHQKSIFRYLGITPLQTKLAYFLPPKKYGMIPRYIFLASTKYVCVRRGTQQASESELFLLKLGGHHCTIEQSLFYSHHEPRQALTFN